MQSVPGGELRLLTDLEMRPLPKGHNERAGRGWGHVLRAMPGGYFQPSGWFAKVQGMWHKHRDGGACGGFCMLFEFHV